MVKYYGDRHPSAASVEGKDSIKGCLLSSLSIQSSSSLSLPSSPAILRSSPMLSLPPYVVTFLQRPNPNAGVSHKFDCHAKQDFCMSENEINWKMPKFSPSALCAITSFVVTVGRLAPSNLFNGQKNDGGQADGLSALLRRYKEVNLGETICSLKEDFIMVHLQTACCTHCYLRMVFGTCPVCNQCKKFQLYDELKNFSLYLEGYCLIWQENNDING
uniref:Uncharacterized protein n=1 Tax=Ananas comosus var. bracteatus TaxID=296719 RepID=A0A6V7NE22_ANACO|nr:unnamed protein product [Ananas comosus var. bracteatus]